MRAFDPKAQVTPGRRGAWMGTYGGRKFWPLDPRPEEVHLDDVAHHLAQKCRYAGALRSFYSVAEHSVIVSRFVPPEFAREALFHDASEAYVGDMIRPLKHQPEMAGFRDAEARITPVVFERFGIVSTEESRAAIDEVDDRIILDEVSALMRRPEIYLDRYPGVRPLGCLIEALDPWEAERAFLDRVAELGGVP